jgi:hypothetical protein
VHERVRPAAIPGAAVRAGCAVQGPRRVMKAIDCHRGRSRRVGQVG